MADDKNLDSDESMDEVVARKDGFEVSEGEVATEGGDPAGVGVDQPGENLTSVLLPDEVEPYELAPDETEAEELDETAPADVDGIDDEGQLAEAEAVAAAATSTRPVRRKHSRAAAEEQLEVDPADTLAATTTSLRPQKKSTLPEKKDHATPKRRSAAAGDEKKRVGPAQFVRESIEELRKVIWPTGAQLWQYFVVVLVFVLFIIAFVSLLDLAFGWVLLKLFG